MAQPRFARLRSVLLSGGLSAALVLGLASPSLAQAVRGTLLGNVTDTQGAAVPGVSVTATETQTNVARTVVTNQSGHYVFANMKDGIYRVATELTGFKKFSRDNIEVKVNSTVRVDIILEVGAMTETVEVVQGLGDRRIRLAVDSFPNCLCP